MPHITALLGGNVGPAHPAKEGSYATHGTNAPPLPPHLKNLIKNVIQECACPFCFFVIFRSRAEVSAAGSFPWHQGFGQIL
jgi:hypothetical protein